jgi:putative DNA primase/helicase
MIKEVVIALAKTKKVFQRAGFIVEPRLDPARKLKNLMRPTDELRMIPVKYPRLRTLSIEYCYFYKMEKNNKVNVSPPDNLANAILSEPEWPGIPVVESISENPVFRKDGTIHDASGYDESSGNYFAADGEVFPNVPDEPTQEEARAAYDVLMDPFVDFPFISENSKAVVAAIILTLLARSAISGPTPPFVIRTPTPRTGKDLLTDVITIIGNGRPTPGRSLPTNDEELKKVLLSFGLSGCRIASFGNCEGAIGSRTLSHAVTRESMAERLLGGNTDITVPLRLVWLFNGNNPRFKGDFGPRVVTCTMDAGIPDPQSRTEWKYDPILPYVREKRPELVTAGLTILRAFHLAGRPRHGKPRKGSFEAWDDLVRGALVWIGVADPLGETAAKEMVDDDVDVENLRAVLSAWKAEFGETPHTLADVVARSKGVYSSSSPSVSPSEANKELAAAFAAIDPKLDDRYTAASLRYFFRHNRGRPIDVEGDGKDTSILRLEIDNPRSGASKVASWYVLDNTTPKGERPKPGEAPPSPPTTSAPATPMPPAPSNGVGKSLFETIL